jgi:DnaJ family protein B protein 12
LNLDKCGAPGTDDAFKAIAGAFSILGDADKRANYDRYGVDNADSASSSTNNHAHAFRGFNGQDFHGQVSPEDLFKMFMGDQIPGFCILNLF